MADTTATERAIAELQAECAVNGQGHFANITKSDGRLILEALAAQPSAGALGEAFSDFVDAIKRGPISWETGVCCCGSPVDGHGFGDGHSPVDEGSYFVMKSIEQAEAALSKPNAPGAR